MQVNLKMLSRYPLFACSLAGFAFAACGGTAETTSPSKVSSIADARALPAESEVTVEGFVTVAPGTFFSATSEKGFALQDDSEGVYVTTSTALDFGLDTKVRVTGRVGELNKLRILASSAAQVERVDGKKTVLPKDVTTGAVNESVEGRLVHVVGKVTKTFEDDSPYGYKLYVDDGSGEVQIFVHISAGLAATGLMNLMGGDTIEVTGLAAQYEDTYEVAPRSPADLVKAP